MWEGWKPDELDNLPHEDALLMWELYQKGMAGPSVHYMIAYNNYAMQHNLTQTLVAAHVNKYKPKEPEKFDKIFPNMWEMLTLRNSVRANKLSIGSQSVIALPGAPEWLLKAASEEIRGE